MLRDQAIGGTRFSVEAELDLAAPEVVTPSETSGAVDGWAVEAPSPLGPSALSIATKRTFDVTVALLGLILFVPLVLLIGVAIWIDSRGPVLFRQTRVGRNGVQFGMFKFRTMAVGAHSERSTLAPLNESSGTFKLRADPRTTRIGRLVRRASLDELPQLLNVLRGEMSLVGPRPLAPEEDALVSDDCRARLVVWPGMTGPWQVLGPIRPPLSEMVAIDCAYAEAWSLRADFAILVRTALHVLTLRGV